MKKTITTGLALMLLAGAAVPALAQDDGRWQGRGGRSGQPQRPDGGHSGPEGGRAGLPQAPQQQPQPQPQPQPVQPQAAPGQAAERAPGGQRFQGDQHRGPEGRHGGWRDGGGAPSPDQRGNNDRRGDDRHWNGGDRRPDDQRRAGDGRRWEGGRPDRNWRPPHPVWQSPQRYRGYAWRAPRGFYERSWVYGDILPRGWFAPNYRLNDWYRYDLPEPPPGYDWVRVGSDALLVDEFSGRVVEVVRLLFW
jgi:Ni/Co efflux regulator RcnB